MAYIANSAPTTRPGPSITSPRMCAIDIDDGHVLYAKNHMDLDDFPASTIKMLSCLIAAELKGSALTGTVTWQSSDDLAAGFSQVGFANGDVVTWNDLIHGSQMVSGGDAIQAMARVLGNENAGNALTSTAGYERFEAMLAAKAATLGFSPRSVLSNGHGAERNPMTARDLAVMTGAAFSNATMVTVCAATSYSISVTGPSPRTINLTRGNTIAGDTGVLGRSKDGALVVPSLGLTTYTLGTLWTSASGNRIAIATLGAASSANRYADTRAVISALPVDFSYLT